MYNDPIAEFLTKIRNAQQAKHKFVDIFVSKIKTSLAGIMKDHGFIENFIINENKRKMRIFLKYTKSRNGIIRKLRRISSPGRRMYVPVDRLPRIMGGVGIAVLSTSKGVMDDEAARKNRLGGEVLCYIW